MSNNPREEADAVLPDQFTARVLEPSPPAIEGDFFADDAVNGRVGVGEVVSPIANGDHTWSSIVADHPHLAEFASERWLGAYRSMTAAPSGYQETLTSLHRLAMAAVAPARHQVNTKFGLRWVRGGFGTPFFGNDQQVRVVGADLIVEREGNVESHPITSIADAAAAIGSQVDLTTATEHDSPKIGSIDEPLAIDAAHVDYISQWWGLGTAALEQVRSDPLTVNPSRVQLWPGHFDIGVEFGDDNTRASFGLSPGDHSHDEPYLYVAAWWPDRVDLGADPFWNSTAFTGASLAASELVGVEDPVTAAIAFYTKARDLLTAAVIAE